MRRLLSILALSACAHRAEPPVQRTREPSPRLDEVWMLATHNAYWVDRGVPNDSFSSGTSERLLDQLIYDRTRSIELDVHRDGRVYHTVPGNGLCDTLRECLAEVMVFHRAIPEHHPLIIVLELKELFAPNFDAARPAEALDEELRASLGSALFSPGDLGCRDETLTACIDRRGWPSLAALRGRILVTLLGNWDELGAAQATVDWAHYANGRNRAAFPMASSWKLDVSTFTPRLQDLITQEEIDRAVTQSVFLQIEDMNDPRIDKHLAFGGIIRVDGANTLDDQRARIARKMQLLQTDTPRIRPDDFALHRLDGPGITESEPFVSGGKVPDGDGTLSTIVVGKGVGCLRATDGTNKLDVCRQKIEAERVLITVDACTPACVHEEVKSVEPTAGGVGDSLQLVAKGNCFRARSARVDFVDVGTEHCFGAPLAERALAATGSVLFAAPTWNGKPL